jgi:transposase-like protein
MRSSSGPDRRVWYSAVQRVFGPRRQEKPGNPCRPRRTQNRQRTRIRLRRSARPAFRHLESILWADGVVCPHCGVIDKAGRLTGVKDKVGRVRPGLWKCYACRKQFTAKVGTVFESAHVHLMCSSKKGISAHQLHRTLEVDYKSAWFLAHRIREAMRDGKLAPMGGGGMAVEVDETYIGRQQNLGIDQTGYHNKTWW